MSAATRLPRPALLLVVSVLLGGAAVTAWQLADIAAWSERDVLAFSLIAAAVAVSEQFWIPLRHQTETENFSLTDAVFAAALILARPSAFLLGVVVGVVAGEARRRTAPHKIAFNAGQFVLGLTLATAVYGAFRTLPEFEHRIWFAATAAMAVYFVTNAGAVALVIALVERKPFLDVLVPPLGLSALHTACNSALGILAALVWAIDPLGLPLLILPLVLSYLAYRGWIASSQEREEMREIARIADSISLEGDLSRRIREHAAKGDVAMLAATLNRMLERLEAAFERERNFIRQISHELRTPITVIRGHLEVLGLDPAPQDVRQTIDLVLDELARMGRIIDDMTTLASAEHPGFVQPEPFRIEPFLAQLAVKAETLLDGRLRTIPPAPGSVVTADPQRLTQALLNLLDNAAVHAGPESRVTLAVVGEPGAWRFEVADDGVGVPAGSEDDVFQPFYRATSSRPGSGLGLAIVRSIAEAHGGSAGVETADGRGVTFWIRVPQ